ncbi:MAG: helix-turn-helix domain-containing protein [Anaerolineales bacterium]|nr:helix-turn-helix domain-containing protein [Anaerolineales bacterium]
MNEAGKNLGKNLNRIRKEKNITQGELGDRIGIGHSSISLWESGVRSPSISYLNQLCKTLGCSADELLGLRVDPYREKQRGIEWITAFPDSNSIDFKSNILNGTEVFRLVVGKGMTLAQIQSQAGIQSVLDLDLFVYRVNAALLSGSVKIVNVERDHDREQRLINKYGLLQCLVARLDDLPDGGVDEPIRNESVAFLAAKFCLPLMDKVSTVGFSGGAPVARFFDLLPAYSPEVTGITWSALLATERYPNMVPMANTANGIVSSLLFKHPHTRGFLMPFINLERRSQEYLEHATGHERAELEHANYVKRAASQVHLAFLSVGSPDYDYFIMERGYFYPEFSRVYHRLSASDKESCVGDLLLRLLDKHGNRIGSPEDQQLNDGLVYSIDLDDLRSMVQSRKQVWVLASRLQKSRIIQSLLATGLANCTVIDNRIADELLD